MKKQTKANIFLGVGIVWFLLGLNGLTHVLFYIQDPKSLVSDYFFNPVAFNSPEEAQGYLFSQATMSFWILIPALIYYFKVRNDVKKNVV